MNTMSTKTMQPIVSILMITVCSVFGSFFGIPATAEAETVTFYSTSSDGMTSFSDYTSDYSYVHDSPTGYVNDDDVGFTMGQITTLPGPDFYQIYRSFVFFNTSYYDISSISRAISHSLNKVLNLEEISAELSRLVTEFSCNYAILYTDSGIIISDCYHDTMDTREFEDIISDKISDDLEFFQRLKDEQVNIDDRVTFSDNSAEYVKRYLIDSGPSDVIFYLGISAPPQKLNEIKIELEKAHPILETTLH